MEHIYIMFYGMVMMVHPTPHLESLSVLTHPRRANIFEMIAEGKNITFKELREKTKMSNDGLAKNLKRLFDSYLIKVSVNKKDENYAKYTLTEKGEHFHDILHNVLAELSNVPRRRVSNLFVMDADTFWKLKEDGMPTIAKVFRGSKIVLTNSEFAKLLEKNEGEDDATLEDLLYSEEQIMVPNTYKDAKNGVMHEFYLRRSKKLSKQDAYVIATAIDQGASLVSDNQKILQAARSLGILCADLKTTSGMDESKPLSEQFYELANRNYGPVNSRPYT